MLKKWIAGAAMAAALWTVPAHASNPTTFISTNEFLRLPFTDQRA